MATFRLRFNRQLLTTLSENIFFARTVYSQFIAGSVFLIVADGSWKNRFNNYYYNTSSCGKGKMDSFNRKAPGTRKAIVNYEKNETI